MMKSFLKALFVVGVAGVSLGNITSAEEVIEAISIEQYFDDGKDRGGTVAYVSGPVAELAFEEDPFSDDKEIKSLTLQKGKRQIVILFEKNLPSGKVTENSVVTIKFKSGPIVDYFTTAFGELISGDVNVATWSSKENPKLEDLITVEDYFDNNLRFGNKRVTLEGTVEKFSKTGAQEVLIEFIVGSNSVEVFIDQSIWKKKEVKDVLKTLKEGDRVQVRGSFMMEGGMTIFTGETLSKI